MALYFSGMPCPLCREPVWADEAKVAFSHFVANPRDPLWPISDAVVHEACFAVFAHRERAERESRRTHPRDWRCDLCGGLIVPEGTPVREAIRRIEEEFVGLPHLTDHPELAAHRFNRLKGHVACLRAAGVDRDLPPALDELAALDDEWSPDDLARMRRALLRPFDRLGDPSTEV